MTTPPMQIPQMSDPNKPPENPNLSSPQGVNPTLGISTNPQPDQVTDPTTIAAQKAAQDAARKEAEASRRAAEQDRQIAELKNTVNALIADKNKPPPRTPDEAAKEFYKDPEKVIRGVMEETVAPLNEFKNSFESESAYTQLKREYRADARYAEYFKRPGFETMIDTVVREASKKNVAVTAQFVESAITHTIGQVATGTVQFPDPVAETLPPKFDSQTGAPIVTPPADPNPANQMIPPYLAPSSPPSPGPSNQAPRRRELTENEDRIRREQNMSVEDWWKWQDMDSKDVVDSKVGVPEPAEKK